jgi:uncharacterized RDD family membrane protein YckC
MWYYSENGEQRGPVTDVDLAALVQTGKIDSETLVWREGQADWQPYRTVKPGPAGVPPPVTTAAGGVFCAECGKTFPAGDVLHYQGVNVCARCKPIFLQKLREGVAVGGTTEYASFWLRVGAYLLDAIIMGVVVMIINMVVFAVLGVGMMAAMTVPKGGVPGAAFFIFEAVSISVNLLCQMTYQGFFLGKFGATPGKMACGIKVVNADGSPVSFLKGAMRPLGYMISACPTICIGFLMMLWDGEKRTLHDRIFNTRVIKS